MRKLLSIVTNTYFAEEFILDTLERLRCVAKDIRQRFDIDVEIVMVDDGSKDRTVELLEQEHAKNKNFRFAKFTKNFGAIHSYRAGIKISKGDAVVHLASDMQEPPEMIPMLVEKWLEGYKFVYCPRESRNDALSSKVFSSVYYYIFNKIAIIKDFPKTGFDMVLMDRQVVNVYLACEEKNYTPQQLIWWMGFKSVSVPIQRVARASGKSGWTFAKKLTLAMDTIISMSYVPIRAMSVIGVITACISFVYGLYILFNAIFGTPSVHGWASLMVIIVFLMGVIMIMLGIIGEYLWRVLENVKGRPSYIIDKISEIE